MGGPLPDKSYGYVWEDIKINRGPRKRCAPVIDFSEILSTKLNRSQLDPEHIYFWELEKRKLEEILRREVLSGQMWPTAVGIFW